MTQAAPLPADIRWMNAVATVLFVGVGVVLAAGALSWLASQPLFAIRSIRVEGDVTRNSVSTIRANAMPQLHGNFFSLDLAASRQAFESVPWVRHAVVRRLWPNRLAVRLEEHRAARLLAARRRRDREAGQQPRARSSRPISAMSRTTSCRP